MLVPKTVNEEKLELLRWVFIAAKKNLNAIDFKSTLDTISNVLMNPNITQESFLESLNWAKLNSLRNELCFEMFLKSISEVPQPTIMDHFNSAIDDLKPLVDGLVRNRNSHENS